MVMKKVVKKKAAKRPARKLSLDIGGTVRTFRQEMGMSTTTLAAKVGTSQAQISRLENNRQGFRSSTLVGIAKVLKVRPWALLMNEAERKIAADCIGLKA